MKYSEFEHVMPSKRMRRYLEAVSGNSRKAMTLYRYNLHLSQELFTIISCFEVALRNSIDRQMILRFGEEWLKVEHGNREAHQDEKIKRGPTHGLSVRFPDGTVIVEKNAAKTLEVVMKRIGVARVRQVVETEGLVFNKVPVISNRRDSKYGHTQRDLGNGWLLITHSNNKTKKRFLDRVSEKLGLGLVVEVKE